MKEMKLVKEVDVDTGELSLTVELRDALKPRTPRQALRASIEKWVFVGALVGCGLGVDDGGSDSCALCQLYLDDNCKGCPVRGRTGKRGCRGTPYDKWREFALDDESEERRQVAEEEELFLRSLLKRKRR